MHLVPVFDVFPSRREAISAELTLNFYFLGGLSLHLNHLIGSRVGNYD